jgi:hypothetical protein
MYVFDEYGDAQQYESFSSISAITQLSKSKWEPISTNDPLMKGLQAKAALITVETANINFTLDGTSPTVTSGTNVGHTLVAGDSILIKGAVNIAAFKMIDNAGSTAVVKVTYFF